MGNVSMIQCGDNRPLAAKALVYSLPAYVPAEKLDRDVLFELAVGALATVDDAHASPPELAFDPVGTHARAGVQLHDVHIVAQQRAEQRAFEQTTRLEQLVDVHFKLSYRIAHSVSKISIRCDVRRHRPQCPDHRNRAK